MALVVWRGSTGGGPDVPGASRNGKDPDVLPDEPAPPHAGYVLISPVGHGATGTVWRGLDSATGDPVAVKLLHEGATRLPLARERSILDLVRHEHVVGVRDLVSVGGALGLAMDLVAGGSLRDRLVADGPFAPAEAARLLAQVAAALRAAHDLGVVHRDVKPDNILLSEADARLTDFGIAKMMDGPAEDGHTVVGTPHYMAPEVISGGEAGPAADVYALGVVLFELITGRTPFAGEGTAVLRAHLDERPRRPVGLPDEVWAVIARCLEKDPARRPDAATLRGTLTRLRPRLEGLPAMRAPAAAPPRHTPPPVPRHRPRERPRNRPRDWALTRPGDKAGHPGER